MSQPVELSDELVLDARRNAERAQRSITEQIEFWAHLGRAIEPLLADAGTVAVRRAGSVRALSECLASVDSAEGRQRVTAFLESRPFPHYEPAPEGLLIRIDADGTRTLGRFVGREFRAAQ
jgi:hypothetical protein